MSDKEFTDRTFGQPHHGHPSPFEEIGDQSMKGDIGADSPDAGEFFIEPAEEQMPEGDRLEQLNILAKQLSSQQWEIADIEAKLATANENERKLREELIPSKMKEVDMKTITLSDGTELTVVPDFGCGIAEETKPLAFKWLRDNRLGGIIKRLVGVAFGKGQEAEANDLRQRLQTQGYIVEDNEGVHWQTLKATLKEEREKGTPIPQDLFSLHEFETTKLKPPRGARVPPKPMFKKK